MIKILNKLSIEEMYVDIIKAICDKPIANIVLSGAKLKAFSNTRNKIGCPPFTMFSQQSAGSPSHSSYARKRNQRLPVGKEEVKLSLFTASMTLYIENSKEFTLKF